MHLRIFLYSVQRSFEQHLLCTGKTHRNVERTEARIMRCPLCLAGACMRRSSEALSFVNGRQASQIDFEVPTYFPDVDRVIAIGDVHGDVDALVGCLKVRLDVPNSLFVVGRS